jgi:hypothetical protein
LKVGWKPQKRSIFGLKKRRKAASLPGQKAEFSPGKLSVYSDQTFSMSLPSILRPLFQADFTSKEVLNSDTFS